MSKQSLLKAVSLIAVITVLSKIFGFARDMVMANAYGASMISDAYFYAYQIPSLALILLGGLGGPFHTATIAVFGKRLINNKNNIPESESRLLSSYMTFTFLFFAIISIFVCVFSLPIVKLITSGATEELQQLSAQLLVIMAPILIIGGLIGIFYGVLNIYNVYFWPSASPLVASIVMIVAIMSIHDKTGIVSLGVGTLVGSVFMILVQVPDFIKSGFKFKPCLDFKIDGLKQIGEILFPAMVGTTIGQINIYVNMFFVSSLPVGSWTAIVYSNRLLQVPIGVLITAMLVPIFPMFTTFVANKDIESLKHYAHKAVRTLWLIAFPMLVYILLFSTDGIKILLERGEFDHHDTLMVSEALIFLSFSMIPYMARDTITRIFYAYEDSKTPLLVGLFAIFVNFILVWLLVKPLGIGGVNLSTTLVTLLNMVLLTILLRRKVKDIGLRKIIIPTLKITIASFLMGGVCYILNCLWVLYLPTTNVYLIIKLITIAIIGFSFYGITTIILGIEETKNLLNRFLKKI